MKFKNRLSKVVLSLESPKFPLYLIVSIEIFEFLETRKDFDFWWVYAQMYLYLQ